MARTITIKINGNGKKPRATRPVAKRKPAPNYGPIWSGRAFGGRGFGTQRIPGIASRTRIGLRRTRLSGEQTVRDIRGAGREVRLIGGDVATGGRIALKGGRAVVRGGRAVFGAAKSIRRKFTKPKPKHFPKVTSKEFRTATKAIPKIENRGPKPVKQQTQSQLDALDRKRRSIRAFDRAAAGKL